MSREALQRHLESRELAVVIVTFRVRDLLRACLESLYRAVEKTNAEIWVVDNASNDGSAEMIAREFPEVRLVVNSRNLGFAAANNQVLREINADFALLLNPDTEVPREVPRKLMAFLRTHPRAGLVAPRLVGADGRTQTSARPFPTLLRTVSGLLGLNLKQDVPVVPEGAGAACKTDWVSGAAMMTRREALGDVGLLEETFFMYGEDVDWCRRFRDRGWEVWYLPELSVSHWGGRSAVCLNRQESRNLWLEHSGRNEYIYFRKHHGRLAAAAIQWATLAAGLYSSFKWRVLSRWRADPAAARLSVAYRRKVGQCRRAWGFRGKRAGSPDPTG